MRKVSDSNQTQRPPAPCWQPKSLMSVHILFFMVSCLGSKIGCNIKSTVVSPRANMTIEKDGIQPLKSISDEY